MGGTADGSRSGAASSMCHHCRSAPSLANIANNVIVARIFGLRAVMPGEGSAMRNGVICMERKETACKSRQESGEVFVKFIIFHEAWLA